LGVSADDTGQKPLFTDNSTANLGVPRNPALSYYHEIETDEFGYVPNAAGEPPSISESAISCAVLKP
jgi:hypothetical protein